MNKFAGKKILLESLYWKYNAKKNHNVTHGDLLHSSKTMLKIILNYAIADDKTHFRLWNWYPGSR